MVTKTDWLAQRAAICLRDGVVNLNAGTCSPTSRAASALLSRIVHEGAGDPVGVFFRGASALIEAGRQEAAITLDADPLDLLMLNNASYGVNTVFRSLAFKPGDEILTTDQEYNQYFPLLSRIERESGARVVRFELPRQDRDPAATPETVIRDFSTRLSPATALVFVSHVTSPTGTVLPVAPLVRLATPSEPGNRSRRRRSKD